MTHIPSTAWLRSLPGANVYRKVRYSQSVTVVPDLPLGVVLLRDLQIVSSLCMENLWIRNDSFGD